MSANAAIIDRIKKLLRLSRSANPHEAQLAMQRAMELAREHDIAVEGLNPDDQAREKTVTHRDTSDQQRLSYDKQYAVMICQRFFRITAIYRKKLGHDKSGWPVVMQCVSFVGTSSDIEIALYVYGFLTHHFAFAWTKHRGRCRNRRAFIDGMFAGLWTQLSAAEPEQLPEKERAFALVVADQKAYIAKFIGETEEKKFDQPDNDASAARRAGYNQGLNTKIAGGLKPAETTLALK